VTEPAAPTGPVVRLNAFQVLMRRWSRLHPYNAGQVMRVSGTGDRDRWKAAIEGVIGELGLGKPRFTDGERAVQYVPVADIPIDHSSQDLESFFNEELNRPFAAGDLPIRFCILPADDGDGIGAGGPSHYLAAVYDHWIADSRAMRELMHRLFDRYRNGRRDDAAPPSSADGLPPLTVAAPPFSKLYRQHIGWLTRLAAMRESLKNIWHHRHAYRLNLVDPLDFTSRFIYRQLPDALIDKLYRFAKARGASVNDLFIAVIAQTTGAYTADDRLGRRKKPLHFARRQVGIGTIVDIRDAASEPLDRVFNLYLSSYTVCLDNPEKRAVADVTQEVAARTSRLKKSYASVKSFWALVMARFWYDLYDSPRFRATLLHKTVPVVAGISNVNMTGSWVDPAPARAAEAAPPLPADRAGDDDMPQILDYLRISPTGPLIPLVFTLTTIRGRLSLCATYRTTTFSEERFLRVVHDFIQRLQEVVGGE
jgi:hypothetical protein